MAKVVKHVFGRGSKIKLDDGNIMLIVHAEEGNFNIAIIKTSWLGLKWSYISRWKIKSSSYKPKKIYPGISEMGILMQTSLEENSRAATLTALTAGLAARKTAENVEAGLKMMLNDEAWIGSQTG
jgi:hypothetical protein